jgi:hypothetical protein
MRLTCSKSLAIAAVNAAVAHAGLGACMTEFDDLKINRVDQTSFPYNQGPLRELPESFGGFFKGRTNKDFFVSGAAWIGYDLSWARQPRDEKMWVRLRKDKDPDRYFECSFVDGESRLLVQELATTPFI